MRYAAMLGALVLLAGCAARPAPEVAAYTHAMPVPDRMKNAMFVRSVTGAGTEMRMRHFITNAAFQKALKRSLETNGLLSNMTSDYKYAVTAEVMNMDTIFTSDWVATRSNST